MAQGGQDWLQDSAFNDLSESWVEHGPISALPVLLQRDNTTTPLEERRRDERGGSSSRSSSSSSTASGSRSVPGNSATLEGKVTSMHNVAILPPIHVKKRGHTGSLSDSELLQPGPSRPSQSKPSYKRTSSENVYLNNKSSDLEDDRIDEIIGIQDTPASPPASSESRFSSGSGEKRGSVDGATIGIDRGKDEADDDDRFNSAREDQSMSLAMTTAAEITCIEHSHVGSNVNAANAAWKQADKGKLAAGLLTKTPSKLRTMFQPLENDVQVQLAGDTERQEGKEEQEEQEQREAAKQGAGKPRDGDRITCQADADQSSGLTAVKEDGVDKSWANEEPRQSVSSEQEELETEKMLVHVPQCVFTFSSPVLQKSEVFPPATPSSSHGLLRLLPRVAPNAELEQILNTPRSERKAGEAHKLVSKLMEQERGERVEKRLRVDKRPKEQTLEDELHLFDTERVASAEASELQPPRDYVRDAPAFMEQLRNLRLASDASTGPSVSTLIVNRKGAKAPTPETSMLRGRPARPLAKGQSPRKMLRLLSAAHQVDEEIEEENRRAEAEAAEGEWQDIVEASPPPEMRTSRPLIPIVSVDPPTQRGLEDIANGAKGTAQRGMLHIGPEDVDTQDLEEMANGRMTFDKAMAKWIPTREIKSSDLPIESSDEASDPFRDIESFVSQQPSVPVKVYSHTPKLQSALRNEVPLSDASSSSLYASQSRASPEQSPLETANNLLSAPKTPNPPVSAGRRGSTPRSILKTAKGGLLTPDGYSPKAMRQEPRSISFADLEHNGASAGRVEKVEDLLRQLAQLALGPDDSIDSMAPRQETPIRKINFQPAANIGARSPWNLSMLKRRESAGEEMGNASFLTNASFNVAHDRILELITDVAPWEPGWQDLKQIDLSKRRVDSLVRLKDFLPALEEAVVDDNEISYLTGLPSSLRLLSLSSNRLPPTVSFGHLINLEYLDISNNHIDEALMSLSPLVHLRHLRVENNGIISLEGIEHLTKLESLNMRQNNLQVVNVGHHQWPRLKDLVLSHNSIVTVRGLSHLKHLRCLNLDHNSLSRIDLGTRMSRLKQLRLSGNVDLASLDVGPAVNLRTLYADDCSLEEVLNLDRLDKLDNLSLRQQNGDGNGINWPAHQTRDIKRLFLSGNAFRSIDLASRASSLGAPLMTKFYSMVYLELSACQLSSLPLDLADLVPNVRHLNADYNLFETLPMLSSLQRLKRFSVIGCRIGKSRKIVESLTGCDELAVLDVRMNPCTMGLYPPIILAAPQQGNRLNKAFLPPMPNPTIARPDLAFKSTGGDERKMDSSDMIEQSYFHKRRPGPDLSSFSSSSGRGHDKDDPSPSLQNNAALFITSDNRFFRTLPAQYRLQRLLHRGALAMACPNLTWLDGLLIDEEEVQQADEYFQGSFQKSRTAKSSSESSGDTL